MKKQIATHNKTFHADEVSAIALLEVFTKFELVINRVNHDTKDFGKYDFIIDIGRKFDGIKYFDHHQFEGGKSSAGLIWDYIGLNEQYPRISKLVDLIDKNDVGIQKAKPFEFSSLIKCFNTKKPSSINQEEAFRKAVEFAKTIFVSMKENADEVVKAKNVVKNSFLFDNNSKIIELSEFNPHWSTYINGEVTPHVKAVVWEDIEEGNWKVRVPPLKLGTFELNGKKLNQNDKMNFVHSSGHFAIAKNETTMQEYLRYI